MKKICIISAKRTPYGRFLGGLARKSAVDLAVAAGRAALKDINPQTVDQVIMGNVLSAGLGMNIARQISVALDIPVDKTAYTVNMMCASGMHSIFLAAQTIQTGNANVVLCGGTESMSNAPYLLAKARVGYKLGDGVLTDSLLKDGLVDSFSNQHMGLTAEALVDKYDISRLQQDEFALSSQQKYASANQNGLFDDEIVKVDKVEADEHPRSDTTMESLASLKPAFKADGSVTAGNSSGINDGAAVVLLCDEQTAEKNGYKPMAYITGWASAGCDPKYMGLGPVYAINKLMQSTEYELADFDFVELNEAFAAQSIACIKELGLKGSSVNPDGGAIAIGHPIGSSGARLVTHIAHKINAGLIGKGLASLCVGGGMGMAAVLQKCP